MSECKLFKNVIIGKNAIIEDFCIIGNPPRGKKDGELTTIIGDNAVIRSHSIIYAGNKIGDNFQTGHSVIIREENKIRDNVSIGTMSCIEHHSLIEDDVRIHSQVFIPEYSILRRHCWIGPNVVLTNAKYPRSRDVKDALKGPQIGKYAKIGANVTVLPGIIIDDYALIGAGSVLTHNVEKYKIAVGNPARVIADIRDNDQYELEAEG